MKYEIILKANRQVHVENSVSLNRRHRSKYRDSEEKVNFPGLLFEFRQPEKQENKISVSFRPKNSHSHHPTEPEPIWNRF